jgi:hypothetical protein
VLRVEDAAPGNEPLESLTEDPLDELSPGVVEAAATGEEELLPMDDVEPSDGELPSTGDDEPEPSDDELPSTVGDEPPASGGLDEDASLSSRGEDPLGACDPEPVAELPLGTPLVPGARGLPGAARAPTRSCLPLAAEVS